MSKDDQEHFKVYTQQNRVKHSILGKYLKGYMTALSRVVDAFHYIDGFAGRGTYGDGEPGSPLIALELLASQSKPCSMSLVENDGRLFAQLSEGIAGHTACRRLHDPPLLLRGEFEDHVTQLLSQPIYKAFRRVATFSFIDPCGVKGVLMQDLHQMLAAQYSEMLLFWNYDGINRWLGAILKETHAPDGLAGLFGDQGSLNRALEIYRSTRNRAEKERGIRDLFVQSLQKHCGAQYVLPFRFEAKDRERTSHYLLHCSNDGLAFKIMKDVMGVTAGADSEAGTFEFLGREETNISLGISPSADAARAAILARLAAGACNAGLFTEDWVKRPTDFFRGPDYIEILLTLEREGKIEVWDKNNMHPVPAAKRMRSGEPTLGKDRMLRLKF